MRVLLTLTLIFCVSWGFSIEVDYGVENGKKFSILTLKHDKKFPCKDKFDINGKNISIECVISGNPQSSFSKNTTEFFNIDTSVVKNNFYIKITPKGNQALFATFLDLKKDVAIPKERPKTSKSWQIVGFDNEIPFLSNKKYGGINFPIKIPQARLPYFRELNIDSTPLEYDEGPDLAMFLNIRTIYNEKKFEECLKLSNEFFAIYPKSIFVRDVLLYKIRSMYHLKDNSDILELAKEWIKLYPADVNTPEVIYMIANIYSNLRIYDDAKYYYNRIIEEYATSKYVQYALVGLAKNIAASGDKRQPPLIFARAYKEAKDVDTASFVSIAWGDYNMLNNMKDEAKNLYDRVVSVNPAYFAKDINESYALFKRWVQDEFFDLAARGGESILEHISNDKFRESLMIEISSWYELANMPNEAHKINTQFLEIFKDSQNVAMMKERDDNLLFSVNEESLEKKIEQYDYLIKTYPNTPNATLAIEKKAQALFTLGKFDEIIAMKGMLPSENLSLKQAYVKLIESAKNCKDILHYYLQVETPTITNNAMEVFGCLYDSKLYAKAVDLSFEMLNSAMGEAKLDWLYNNAMANYQAQDYTKATLAARDAFTLSQSFKKKQDIGVILFISLANLDRKDEANRVFEELLKLYPNSKDMLKVYDILLNWAIGRNDAIATERYAKEILRLQGVHKVREYSPFTELALANVLFEDNRYTQMLGILKDIFSYQLSSDEEQKVRYYIGSANYELGNSKEARESFEKCIGIVKDSNFGKLCDEALRVVN